MHRDCNINVKLNHYIPLVFHNSKYYGSDLIMQKLGKFNLKMNVIPSGLEKYMSLTINNKLSLIDSFQILRSLLDSLVKIWVKMILSIWAKNLTIRYLFDNKISS